MSNEALMPNEPKVPRGNWLPVLRHGNTREILLHFFHWFPATGRLIAICNQGLKPDLAITIQPGMPRCKACLGHLKDNE